MSFDSNVKQKYLIVAALKKIVADNKFLQSKEVVTADFKTAQKKFEKQGIPPKEIKYYLSSFKDLKPKIKNTKQKDIDYWATQTWDVFKTFVDTISKNKSKSEDIKQSKITGANLVFEDDNWYVYKILSYEAAKYYGKGTKWCITRKGEEDWSKFSEIGWRSLQHERFYFLISKTRNENDPFYKIVANIMSKNEKPIFWDARNVETNRESIESILPNYDFPWFEGVKKEI